jgi:hypothetical protein
MEQFFTLEWLGTAAGMVAFVALMVEVCKFMIPVYVNPKWYCIGWALAAMAANVFWLNPVTAPGEWFSAAINVLLVAVAATGTFEYAIKPVKRGFFKPARPRSSTAKPVVTGNENRRMRRAL